LEEVRDTIFTDVEFCNRFLNEELKSSDAYQEGSQTKKLVIIKELFATHIVL